MTITILRIDLGKNLSSIVGLDADERVVMRRRVRRATLSTSARRFIIMSVIGGSSIRLVLAMRVSAHLKPAT